MRSSKLLIAVLGAGFLILSLSNTHVTKDTPASEPSMLFAGADVVVLQPNMLLAGSDLVLSPEMLVA